MVAKTFVLIFEIRLLLQPAVSTIQPLVSLLIEIDMKSFQTDFTQLEF